MSTTTFSTQNDTNIAQQILFKMASMEPTSSPLVFKAIEIAAKLYQRKVDDQIVLNDILSESSRAILAEMLAPVGIQVAVLVGANKVYKNTFQTVYAFRGEEQALIHRLNMQDGDMVYQIATAY